MRLPEDMQPSDEMIPDGSLILHGCFVVEYVDSDGESQYVAESFGDARLAESVGLLEIGKGLLMEQEGEEE